MTVPCPEETGFGYVVIAGRRYDHDVVVYPDGRVERRTAKHRSKPEADRYQHTPLSGRELAYYIERSGAKPDCVVVGTGQSGAMKVTPEAAELASRIGARLVAVETSRLPKACGELRGCERPLIVIHVTC